MGGDLREGAGAVAAVEEIGQRLEVDRRAPARCGIGLA